MVAVGPDQVALCKSNRLAALEQSFPVKFDVPSESESDSSSDNDDRTSTDHISIRPTRHAKQMQKKRGITDGDIRKAIGNAKAPERKHNGVKVIKSGGISAVIAGGQKLQIITTWKEEPSTGGGHYLDRWTKLAFADDKTDGYIQQQTVTVVERSQRYEKSGCRIGKYIWSQGQKALGDSGQSPEE